MAVTVVSSEELRIDVEHDIVRVRHRVREIAQRLHLDSFAIAAVTTAASELSRNVWMHARGGVALVEEVTDGARGGIRATFRDQGPGIGDVERAMAGGYSTARSMGLGLSGSKRLVDAFDLETQRGVGTTVSFIKWKPY
ncbi:MAG TPA: anti-sigma regulatory factor [Byssovorax sp.]|jgi:serine/threonine-protein kinase RsbT